MVLCFTTGPALLFSSRQLADSPGSDVADICIPMNVPPLPSLDICHDHYKSSPKYKRRMQCNMNCAHWRTKDMCKVTFTEEQKTCKRHVQRNMKCVHQSTKFVCNVTWSVFTTVKRHVQRNIKCLHRSTKDVHSVTWSVFTEEQMTCATQHEVYSSKNKRHVQRNMKCVHQSTKFVCNVTWSVFTTVKRHVQRNIKCLHRSTKDVHSVSWSVFLEEQMTCATQHEVYSSKNKRHVQRNMKCVLDNNEDTAPYYTPTPQEMCST